MTLRQYLQALIQQLQQLPTLSEGRRSTIKQKRVVVTYIIKPSPIDHVTRFSAKTNLQMTLLLRAPNSHSNSTTTMHPRPSLLRFAQLASRQTRPSPLRSTIQRRFNHSTPPKLEGPMDNAFNRNRIAVKEHAKDSTGKSELN